MPTYTKLSFTPNQTPLSEGGDFLTESGSGLNSDANGFLVAGAGWNSSALSAAVDTWGRDCYIEADVNAVAGNIGAGFLNPSNSSLEAAGIRFHVSNGTSALLRAYTDASSSEGIYTSLPTPSWAGTATKIGIELTDSATADTLDYQVYVDTGSGMTAVTTNGSGTITMQDGVTALQPWLAGNGGGELTAFEARDSFLPANTLTITETSVQPEGQVTLTTSITDATSASGTDGTTNLALTDFAGTNGSYTANAPAIPVGSAGWQPGATITITVTNGVDTATDTVTYAAPDGFTQLTAITQAAGLVAGDLGYVGDPGLDAALTAGDIVLTDYAGDNTDGTTDEPVSLPLTVNRYYWDLETAVYSYVQYTYPGSARAFGAYQVESNPVQSNPVQSVEV